MLITYTSPFRSPQLVLSLPQSEDPTSATSSSSSESSLVRWGTTFPQNLLPFTFSFTDLDINLALDPLLPRITQLAQHSPDRKTKVAACELLHAITVYLVGKSAMQTDSNNNTSSSFTTLYTKLFPCLIRLAVDLESIARSLFRPLFLQLIHWFTRNSQYENQDTISILNSCLDAVSSSNGPIRDFGADCCVEFLKYSIKQTTAEEQVNEYQLIEFLLPIFTHLLFLAISLNSS